LERGEELIHLDRAQLNSVVPASAFPGLLPKFETAPDPLFEVHLNSTLVVEAEAQPEGGLTDTPAARPPEVGLTDTPAAKPLATSPATPRTEDIRQQQNLLQNQNLQNFAEPNLKNNLKNNNLKNNLIENINLKTNLKNLGSYLRQLHKPLYNFPKFSYVDVPFGVFRATTNYIRESPESKKAGGCFVGKLLLL
jgi:hypothetical protein